MSDNTGITVLRIDRFCNRVMARNVTSELRSMCHKSKISGSLS